jgi:hypothetical protein
MVERDRVVALDRTLRLLAELVDADVDTLDRVLGSSVVRIHVVATALADAPSATQAAVATLVSLMARSGLIVEIDVPDVPTETPLLRDGAATLREALFELVDNVLPGSARPVTTGGDALVVIVGPGLIAQGRRVVHAAADAWDAGFAAGPCVWRPADVLVALAAACLVAGEALRDAIRDLPPREEWAQRALRPIDATTVTLPPLPQGVVGVGGLDVISAGAVTDALMWSLRARGGVQAHGRVFDDGVYDPTNLNRYMELDRQTAHAGRGKAANLASHAPDGLSLEAVERRFGASDVDGAAATILVGADDVVVRHLAQRSAPDWLGIGATSHFEVRVTEHRVDGPCAGCAHPHTPPMPAMPIPTCAPVSFWAGLQLAVRFLRSAVGGFDLDDSYATYYPLTRPGVDEVGPCQFHPECPLDPRHRRLI